MKILALDSSGLVASVALVEDDILVAEYTMNYKKTHSQTLLPMLDEIRRQSIWIWRVSMPLPWQQDRVLLPDFALALQRPKDWDWLCRNL